MLQHWEGWPGTGMAKAHTALGLGEPLALCAPVQCAGSWHRPGVVELPDTAWPPLTLVPCTPPVPHGAAHCPSPEVGLQHPVQALVERPGGEVACPVVILPVGIGEEIPSQNWEPGWSHPRHDAHFLVQGIKVVRECAKLCLQDSTCSPEPGLLQWELLSPLQDCSPLQLCSATASCCPQPHRALHTYLDVEVRPGVEKVKDALVVEELGVPLLWLVIAEVISQGHQQHLAAVQLGLLAVLVQQQLGSVQGSGHEASPWWPAGLGAMWPWPCRTHRSATLASVMARGGTFQGQLMRPPGKRLKSNWQQILGSGPQVWGTS